MAEIKKALAIDLPVSVNKKAVITLMSNQKAQTYIKRILCVSYNEGYIFLTVETKNSIYKDIPVPVYIQNTFFNGQIIQQGYNVTTSDGSLVPVAMITDVTKEGIHIIDANNQSYFGSVASVNQ